MQNVATTVSAIESLRSKLFVKLLPPLYQEHAARTIFCDGVTWVVVTAEKDLLPTIGRVVLNNAADTGEHIELYDIENKQILPIPKDIVVLYQSISTPHKQMVKDLIDAGDDILCEK